MHKCFLSSLIKSGKYFQVQVYRVILAFIHFLLLFVVLCPSNCGQPPPPHPLPPANLSSPDREILDEI